MSIFKYKVGYVVRDKNSIYEIVSTIVYSNPFSAKYKLMNAFTGFRDLVDHDIVHDFYTFVDPNTTYFLDQLIKPTASITHDPKEVGISYGLKNVSGYDKGYILTPKECSHEFVEYLGFSESYYFCKKCDQKRNS